MPKSPGDSSQWMAGAARWLLLWLVVLWFADVRPLRGQTGETVPEYQVKAAFLYNFARYVEWPESAFDSPNAPLVIGVLGQDPFGSYLDEAVAGKLIGSHLVTVRHVTSADYASTCHVLFICRSEKEHFGAVIGALRARPILTVGEENDFTKQGGAVAFRKEDNRVRFEINVLATERAQLKVSAQLLKLARVTHDGR